MELTHEIMYQASLDKDISFEGIFYTAVKTTGIFCRPSCTARKPKRENVEFLKTVKDCITKGYRPCKICCPLEKLNETPSYITELINELIKDPSIKFKDCDLVKRGVEPNKVRRWFLKSHKITFHAYQRMFRINSAFKKIRNGDSVTKTAFDSGFDSLSGFGDSFKSIFGTSPKNSKSKTVIDFTRIETPLGTMCVCAVEDGICLLEFTDRRMLETEFKMLSEKLNAIIIQGSNKHFRVLEDQLNEYFSGSRKEFSVPLVTPGTLFQNKVWKTLQEVPFGSTISYGELADIMNNSQAVRAVANANGMNKIAILIPCHRVIGADGKLTGYGGGLWRKQYLIELEQQT
ncbi:bifunctional transcriptional activator/DNA repair enzyme AdaA [Pedobacter cryoconitis]|uniref:Methylated-DNA--protein-cysteine methyltransferase n=1 Tax=Pedobacter cryoconitis TaxID=188932 RepID=A0A327SBT0_9SPHI|nr:methylated-DNA--[protein]-cysteine S-methyltransferase [Pedobacter cryoconitis]RAJ26391.1 AraC family transcriptional regulator of adaptative response/methylated-DNA-[protein]-cysteine methyltransferase [Pedobacter cryoconitis]